MAARICWGTGTIPIPSFARAHADRLLCSTLAPHRRAQNGAFSSGDRIPVPQQEITQSVAALVLAGGSSDNPLARARAMPALEIGMFSLPGSVHHPQRVHPHWRSLALVSLIVS
jgi:hypothetical protein